MLVRVDEVNSIHFLTEMTAPSSMQSPILFSLNWHSSGELAKEDLEHILMLLAGANESGSDEHKAHQIKVA